MTDKEMAVVKHCQIHLTEPARTHAANALHPLPPFEPEHFRTELNPAAAYKKRYAAELKANREFTGPHFHGVGDMLITDTAVVVQIGDAEYAYPMHTIARVKSYTTTHTPE